MGEQNYSIDTDLKEAQALTAALVPYVYEDELYGKVGVNMPRLTVGAVLLRVRRLQALQGTMSAEQSAWVDQLVAQHEGVRKEWGTHYVQKCIQEVTSRTRDILTYLKECREDPRLCASAYMPEALRRTMIEEILSVLPEADLASSGLSMKVKEVDSGLHRNGRDSDFIWAEALRPVYPQQPFWWLYSRPSG